MSIVVPNTGEVIVLEDYLESEDLILKLFSNDVVPAENSTTASFTEVAGGGYSPKTLGMNNWTITPGNPSQALYAQQTFGFTGPTTAPGTIYGYFIVDQANNCRWAERFPAANVPLTPVSGSSIRITPKFECS